MTALTLTDRLRWIASEWRIGWHQGRALHHERRAEHHRRMEFIAKGHL